MVHRYIFRQAHCKKTSAGGTTALANGLPLLRRILDQGSPLIEAGLLDPDRLKAAVTELENGPYSEDPWSKLVEVVTLDQAARAFLR